MSAFRHGLAGMHDACRNHAYLLQLRYPGTNANSELTARHFSTVCETEVPADGIYVSAYKRWHATWQRASDDGQASLRSLRFEHRLLINLAQPSLWESSVSLQAPYGVPSIPGSALKGLARHFAKSQLGIPAAQIDAIFGSSDSGRKVQFMDAWWVPGSAPGRHKNRPLVREQVAPHHFDFMQSSGKVPATPFDSPVPSPQIATHGQFLFLVQGPKLWSEYALNILQVALEVEGIGARTPEYGCIARDQNAIKAKR